MSASCQDALSLSQTLSQHQQNNNAAVAAKKEPTTDGGNVSDRLEKIRNASEGWKKRIGRFLNEWSSI